MGKKTKKKIIKFKEQSSQFKVDAYELHQLAKFLRFSCAFSFMLTTYEPHAEEILINT